jgi:asparaginyl-tRNA synthetase
MSKASANSWTPRYHYLVYYMIDEGAEEILILTIQHPARSREYRESNFDAGAAHLTQGIRRFFDTRGFFWVNTPIITASDAEGAGALFRVSTLDLVNLPRTPEGKVDFAQDFFGREAFLTVSGQLNVEAYCLALTKVYTFGPTFRAENSNTSRHLAEFWMIEPEIAFADLSDNAALAEALLK